MTMRTVTMKTLHALIAVAALACSMPAPAASADPAFDAELLALQQAWAQANYHTPPGDAQVLAFEQLEKRAEAFTQSHPGRAEALIWEGIIESSFAGAKGGLGALSLAKEARANLEKALKLDPAALDGSAYTSLGTLYYKVPGFPLGFGDDDKAQAMLQKALELNPHGIDPNFFYGEFLTEQGHYAEALEYLQRAAGAPPRPGREAADQGRRAEIAALITKVKHEMG
jgi:tetratricopeptide (TPR) repeat protein